MNRSVKYSFVIFTVAVCLIEATRLQATVLLQDDFNDNSLNPAKWTTSLPRFGSHVYEQNQRVELYNRGYLITQNQFEPAALGGMKISGNWTFTFATLPDHDFLQIVTRTDANSAGPSGEVTSGISFVINGNDALVIQDKTNNITLTTLTPFPIEDGNSFHFEVIDDGFNLNFFVQEIGGDGTSAVASATSTLVSPINRVAFYNREELNHNEIGYLDDVMIEAPVPEPSAIYSGLFALGSLIGIRILRIKRLGANSDSAQRPIRGRARF